MRATSTSLYSTVPVLHLHNSTGKGAHMTRHDTVLETTRPRFNIGYDDVVMVDYKPSIHKITETLGNKLLW